MDISALSNAITGPSDPLAALGLRADEAAGKSELGQSDFLKLMTTQLQSQDPLEPMENGAFIAQLAQFSTVSGMETLVNTVESLAGALTGAQALEASNLLGRGVLVPAPDVIDTGRVSERGAAVDLPATVFDVRVRVEDASGTVLGRIDLGDAPKGLLSFDWSAFAPANGGVRLVAEGTLDGERTELPVLAERAVEAVTLDTAGRGMQISLDGGGTAELGEIRRMF